MKRIFKHSFCSYLWQHSRQTISIYDKKVAHVLNEEDFNVVFLSYPDPQQEWLEYIAYVQYHTAVSNYLLQACTRPCMAISERGLSVRGNSSNLIWTLDLGHIARTYAITVTSQAHHGVSDHWQLDHSFNSLFSLKANKTSKLHITGCLWQVGSPTKDQQCGKRAHVMASYSITHTPDMNTFSYFTSHRDPWMQRNDVGRYLRTNVNMEYTHLRNYHCSKTCMTHDMAPKVVPMSLVIWNTLTEID